MGLILPESIEYRVTERSNSPSSAANWISLSIFCYINQLAALLGGLAKIASWISLLLYSLWWDCRAIYSSSIYVKPYHKTSHFNCAQFGKGKNYHCWIPPRHIKTSDRRPMWYIWYNKIPQLSLLNLKEIRCFFS